MNLHESWRRDLLRLIVWYPLRWFCTYAPLKVNYSIFALMGKLHYTIAGGHRKLLKKRLTQYLGNSFAGKTIDKWILSYFCNHYADRMSIFHYHRLNSSNVSSIINFDGLSHIDKSLKVGKGIVLVHGHMGPSQLPLIALGALGYPLTQLGFRTDEGLSKIGKNVQLRLRMEIEEQFPAEMLYVDKFQRQVFRSIAANRIVMTAGDGSGRKKQFGHYLPLPFLNMQYNFATGPFKLAEKTDATLLFLFIQQNSIGSYSATIRPATYIAQDMEAPGINSFAYLFSASVAESPGLWHLWDTL